MTRIILGIAALVTVLMLAARAEAQPTTYLPWQYGESHYVSQGNNGGYSHNTSYTQYGWDFSMSTGTTVLAAAPGTVSKAVSGCVQGDTSCNYGWGNAVVVCYGDGSCSRYGHLSAVSVGAGQQVAQAQKLGAVGSTGNSSGPHLHYQLENGSGSSLPSSFAEAGVPGTGATVTSRNRADDPKPVFTAVRVFSSDTLDVTAGDQVKAVVTAHYNGPKAIPCGYANLGVRGDGPAKFADAAAGWWPKSPWRSANRAVIVGCNGYLNPGDEARWDLAFRPPVTTASGTYLTGVFSPVWDGVVWSDTQIPISLKVTARYAASFVGQEITPLTAPGSLGKLSVALKNTGLNTWTRETVHLGTKDDKPFPYADSSWVSDRNRLLMREETVAPGEIAHFDGGIAPPASAGPDRFRQYFGLVLEGKGWFGSELGVYLPVFIGTKDRLPYLAGDYGAKFVDQTYASGSLRQGDSARVTVTYRNTGTAALFRDGQHPVNLRGINPQDRASGLVDSADSSAIGAQGVRLAVDRVDPGEQFTFTIPVKVASSVQPGTYQEYFRPVAEGTTWFGPSDVFWPFTVTP